MRNAPFAFLWHSATRGRQQEKYSLVSQGCQSSPSCFQPDRQSAPSFLLVAKSPFPMKMHFTVKISIDALRFPHTQGVCGIPHSRKNLCVVHLNDVSDVYEGGVGYFSNERGFSVESSLQRISSKKLLWKRNDSSVVSSL